MSSTHSEGRCVLALYGMRRLHEGASVGQVGALTHGRPWSSFDVDEMLYYDCFGG